MKLHIAYVLDKRQRGITFEFSLETRAPKQKNRERDQLNSNSEVLLQATTIATTVD